MGCRDRARLLPLPTLCWHTTDSESAQRRKRRQRLLPPSRRASRVEPGQKTPCPCPVPNSVTSLHTAQEPRQRKTPPPFSCSLVLGWIRKMRDTRRTRPRPMFHPEPARRRTHFGRLLPLSRLVTAVPGARASNIMSTDIVNLARCDRDRAPRGPARLRPQDLDPGCNLNTGYRLDAGCCAGYLVNTGRAPVPNPETCALGSD